MNAIQDKTIKHLFVFLEIFECEGGIQSYVKDIFQAYLRLAEPGQAEVFLLRDGPESENPFVQSGLKFHYLKSRSPALGRIRLAVTLLKTLLQYRSQRQHVFCGHIKLAPLVQALCQPLGIPYTILTYGKEVWEPLSSGSQRSLRQAAGVWTISRYSRDRLCQANQIDPKRVALLPCAINGEQFTPGPKSPDLLEQYGLAGQQVLMTVARLWSGDIYKGVDVTIRALPAITQVFPQVKYLVIGRGDDQPRLAQLAQDLGVADRVVFAGFVPTDALVEHYRLADAYVMPSQEGFGIVYLEAMACGVPVLAGNTDGSADPLQDGRLGWQVPHRDSQAVAEACIEILKACTAPSALRQEPCCDGQWLRQEALAAFGTDAFTQCLGKLLASTANICE